MKTPTTILVIICTLLISGACAWADNPRERLDYWQNNFKELSAEDDPRAATAHDIFKRLLRVAGTRPGVVPRLFIAESESPSIPLAFAIPDGGVIITKRIIDICFMDENRGEDRLAFVLAHEIAHQLKDDFWHMKFFQAVELSKNGNEEDELLQEVRDIASETDKVLAKELQADEHGIIYASMAGFNTSAIVMEDDTVSFFEFFYRVLDPTNVKGVPGDSTHPTPAQRAQTVKTRLKQVVDKTDLFKLGLLFYQAGRPEQAALFFGEFLRFFPSREVYHNLAASHHQIALEHYRKWKGEGEGLLFRLSLTVATETRASQIQLRGGSDGGGEDPEERFFREHILKAVEYYSTAISQDPAFVPSYNNLGCALILLEEPYKAIGILKDALKIEPENPGILNNLGVAYYLAENPSKAGQALNRALELDPSLYLVLFNLGRIAFDENDRNSAEKYWSAYLKSDSTSTWASYARKSLSMDETAKQATKSGITKPEDIFGVEAGFWIDEIPEEWNAHRSVKEFPIQEDIHVMVRYGNGLLTVWQDDELLIAMTPENYKGKSTGGIVLGSSVKELMGLYGPPARTIDMSQWTSWIYPSREIAFQVRDGKVVSWMIYLED